MGRTLIIMLVFSLMLLAGCQTVEGRASAAAEAKGQSAAAVDFPPLPEACTAHVQRVKPKVGEKFRWINQRWEITADNRDRQADDCRAWGQDMRTRYGKLNNSIERQRAGN